MSSDATSTPPTVTAHDPVRYRCTSCGNLTRFDVTSSRRTKAFHHYSVGGELTVEDVDVLAEEIEVVECRWCGPAGTVVPFEDGPDEPAPDPEG